MSEYDSTIGVLFIGLLVATALWGLSCSQAWNYFRDYPDDIRGIKAVVCIAWIMDTVHQALISHTLYVMLITNFDNPLELLFIPWSLPVSVPFFEATALAVQLFFAYRIWKLSSKSWIWTGSAVVLILAKLGCGIAYTVKAVSIQLLPELNVKIGRVMTTYVAVDFVTDVTIAVIMCWLLYASKTDYQRTNSIVNRLIFFTTTTGALTGLTAIAGLAVRAASPNSAAYFPLYFAIGRLYVNSLLAALNMRTHLRQTQTSNAELSPIDSDSPRSSSQGRWKGLAIHIKRSTDHMQDPKHVLLDGEHKDGRRGSQDMIEV